jgi:hypothetical protein
LFRDSRGALSVSQQRLDIMHLEWVRRNGSLYGPLADQCIQVLERETRLGWLLVSLSAVGVVVGYKGYSFR